MKGGRHHRRRYTAALVLGLLLTIVYRVAALSGSPVVASRPVGVGDSSTTSGRPGSIHNHRSLVLRLAQDNTGALADDEPFLLEEEYALTEQMITQRGEREEVLMACSTSHPIIPNEFTGARPILPASSVKEQRGFGSGPTAGSKKGKKRKSAKKDAVELMEQSTKSEIAKCHANVLKNEGLVRIDNVLSDSVTDKLRAFVYDIRATEGNKANATGMQGKFPTIRRWDLSIPLFEYTAQGAATTATTVAHHALTNILVTTVVGETMRSFLGTDQAELYELSSYISDPGSSRQVVHSDTPCFGTNDDQPILCTCFIALQDVRMDMGPTAWLPKTNTYAIHDLYFGEDGQATTPQKDHFLQTHESVVGILPKGSCVLFDSRLLHCGTANKSMNDSRALFFFSFQHPGIVLSNPGGDNASIRPDLKGRFRLSDFVRAGD
jgi:ectoine hydroxylase-related dioxygenase (phytanoyl-CoA dioxygenase family)